MEAAAKDVIATYGRRFTIEECFRDIKDDRMVRAIGQLNESYGLPRIPTPGEVFNRSFLPPKAERMVKAGF
jgi:hypothetical protein